MYFDGSDDSLLATGNIITGYPFTLVAYAYIHSFASGGVIALNASSNQYWTIGTVSTSKLRLSLRNTTSYSIDSGTKAAGLYGIAGVFSSSTLRTLYVNGVYVNQNTDSVDFASCANTYLAKYASGTGRANCSIITASVYSRELSGSEIQSIYASPYQFLSRVTRKAFYAPAGGGTNYPDSVVPSATASMIAAATASFSGVVTASGTAVLINQGIAAYGTAVSVSGTGTMDGTARTDLFGDVTTSSAASVSTSSVAAFLSSLEASGVANVTTEAAANFLADVSASGTGSTEMSWGAWAQSGFVTVEANASMAATAAVAFLADLSAVATATMTTEAQAAITDFVSAAAEASAQIRGFNPLKDGGGKVIKVAKRGGSVGTTIRPGGD
jgi:hypothetical protein